LGDGRIESLHNWYNYLNLEGNKFGYLVNGSKKLANIIVKSHALADEAQRIFGEELKKFTSQPMVKSPWRWNRF
jgi:hypothetical protein